MGLDPIGLPTAPGLMRDGQKGELRKRIFTAGLTIDRLSFDCLALIVRTLSEDRRAFAKIGPATMCA